MLLSLLLLAPHVSPPGSTADDDTDRRLAALEARNQALEAKVASLTDEVFRLDVGEVITPLGDGRYGLGPAASKVYFQDQGVSIGGYGELDYQAIAGGPNEVDLHRVVLYVGYKFSERWVLNTEVEFEHAGEEVAVEFATLDYLGSEAINGRVGLVLVPMGFLSELHEPTTYLSTDRPQTETRILPSTWSEMGVGVFGDAGPIRYRAYVVNGFDATGFDKDGLRGGRQAGDEALAEDLAVVLRGDWTEMPGMLVGGSVYAGAAGQSQAGLGDTGVTIWEVHGEVKQRGLWVRVLFAMASVDDVTELNAANGFTGADSVGEELQGGYLEVAYDVWQHVDAGSQVAVRPFVRLETVDTQSDVPGGFSADADTDFDLLTYGVQVQPNPHLVFKLDFQDWDEGDDRFSASVGWVF